MSDEDDEIQERVETVGARPDVQKWMRAFERLCKAMPNDIHVFVASGTPCVLAMHPDGQPYSKGEGYNQRALIGTPEGYHDWDGGDW